MGNSLPRSPVDGLLVCHIQTPDGKSDKLWDAKGPEFGGAVIQPLRMNSGPLKLKIYLFLYFASSFWILSFGFNRPLIEES